MIATLVSPSLFTSWSFSSLFCYQSFDFVELGFPFDSALSHVFSFGCLFLETDIVSIETHFFDTNILLVKRKMFHETGNGISSFGCWFFDSFLNELFHFIDNFFKILESLVSIFLLFLSLFSGISSFLLLLGDESTCFTFFFGSTSRFLVESTQMTWRCIILSSLPTSWCYKNTSSWVRRLLSFIHFYLITYNF